MTKTEKAVSWGLTGFFGLVCVAAAPQLSVGFFVKYGVLSTALGFGITAISNAVGKLFPDNDYSYTASGSRTVHHHHHDRDSSPRHHWWFGNSYSNRNTSSTHGAYVGSRVEPVSTPVSHTNHGTYLGSKVEPVQQPPVTPPSNFSSLISNPGNSTYLGRRIEPIVASQTPSAPPLSDTGNGTFLGSRVEPVTPSYSSPARSRVANSYDSTPPSSEAKFVGRRVEML